jgi:ABC-type sugar transport system ATPase subunit
VEPERLELAAGLRSMAAAGAAVLMGASSEADLLRICDRVVRVPSGR